MNKEFQRYKLPYHFDKVPKDSGGIYFFTFRFPSDYELGLTDKGNSNVDNILTLTKAIINKYSDAYNCKQLSGLISEGKSEHIRSQFALNAECQALLRPSDILENIPADNTIKLKELLSLIRIAFEVSTPLYIGLTFEQSLSERLQQHLNGGTAIKPFLEQFGLSWENLYFNCITVRLLSKKELRESEKLIQNIFKPVVSTN